MVSRRNDDSSFPDFSTNFSVSSSSFIIDNRSNLIVLNVTICPSNFDRYRLSTAAMQKDWRPTTRCRAEGDWIAWRCMFRRAKWFRTTLSRYSSISYICHIPWCFYVAYTSRITFGIVPPLTSSEGCCGKKRFVNFFIRHGRVCLLGNSRPVTFAGESDPLIRVLATASAVPQVFPESINARWAIFF